jgi:hypothetical protein
MRLVSVRAVGAISAERIGEVQQTFEHCHTLADLLAWGARQSPRVQVAEIVTQDEYTHDVVLPYGSIYLSFDTT